MLMNVFYKRLIVPVCVMLGLLACINSAQATAVKNLLDSEVVVPDQSARHRQQALQKAFSDVLVRYSGTVSVLRDPSIKAAIKTPSRYLNQYQYTTGVNARGDNEIILQADFQAKPLKALLNAKQLPIWSDSRPNIVAWIVVDDNTGRNIVSNNNNVAVAEIVMNEAKRRGLPLTLPTYDMTDLQAVDSSDVWALDVNKISVASLRYDADALLIGRVVALANGGWQSNWQLIDGNIEVPFSSEGKDLSTLLQPIIDSSAETLSTKYAVISGSGNVEMLQISVAQIDSFAKYTDALLYLRNLGAVKSVTPSKIDHGQVVFSLKINADTEKLWQAIALNNHLVQRAPPAPIHQVPADTSNSSLAPTLEPIRYFDWQGQKY